MNKKNSIQKNTKNMSTLKERVHAVMAHLNEEGAEEEKENPAQSNGIPREIIVMSHHDKADNWETTSPANNPSLSLFVARFTNRSSDDSTASTNGGGDDPHSLQQAVFAVMERAIDITYKLAKPEAIRGSLDILIGTHDTGVRSISVYITSSSSDVHELCDDETQLIRVIRLTLLENDITAMRVAEVVSMVTGEPICTCMRTLGAGSNECVELSTAVFRNIVTNAVIMS
jgi:hypothetical protein